MNPGNNHLSATLIPAPVMFLVMTTVWIGVAVGWASHVLIWWKASVALHCLMAFYPAVKVAFAWYAYKAYKYYSMHGDYGLENYLFFVGSKILFQVIFNLLLLVISRGWGISRSNLKSDKYYIFSILASMSILMMLENLYQPNNSVLVCKHNSLSWVVRLCLIALIAAYRHY